MSQAIDNFTGKFRWLSNFWEAPFHCSLLGCEVKSVEHAYQALKAIDPEQQQWVLDAATPGISKRRGKTVACRPDWDKIKYDIMRFCVMDKFMQNKHLSEALVSTGEARLIEGNTWGDTYWGVCNGVGKNKLGKILMEVRETCKSLTA